MHLVVQELFKTTVQYHKYHTACQRDCATLVRIYARLSVLMHVHNYTYFFNETEHCNRNSSLTRGPRMRAMLRSWRQETLAQRKETKYRQRKHSRIGRNAAIQQTRSSQQMTKRKRRFGSKT
ncbi:unnamed protein product [Ixodes persulcatus]